jgi:putative toxin-antitoxin system antitoxin component (TIGR02293 family)
MTATKGTAQREPVRKTSTKAATPPSRKASRLKIEGEQRSPDLLLTDPQAVSGKRVHVLYVRSKGIDDFVSSVYGADPIRLIETERKGVAGVFVKDLSKRMEIPAQRMFAILGVPKATAEKKVAAGELLTGSGGRAALGIARLLGMAKEIVENSTAPEAVDFDAAKWLGVWLEKPQPALGGRKPAELIDTPTGVEVVARLLGAIESGAYQ